MATRTIWQDVYAMQMDVENTTLVDHLGDANDPNFVATADVGIWGTGTGANASGQNGRFSLALTDHPNFKAPSGSLDTEQATGKSTRQGSEYNVVQTGEAVQFTLPLLGDAYNVSAFAKLLFQSGHSEAAPTSNGEVLFRTACTPYTSADCSDFAWFVRLLGGSTDDPHDLKVSGGLCHTLTLSGESGGVLSIEPTIYGAKWEQLDLSSHATTLGNSFPDTVPLKFQDSTFAILDPIGMDETNAFVEHTQTDCIFTTTTVACASTPFLDAKGYDVADVVIIEGSASNDGVYPVDVTTTALLTIDATVATGHAFSALTDGRSITITPAKWRVINVPSASFTITNNCIFNYYNDDVASNAIVGRMGVEGSFQMPFGTTAVGKNYMIDRFLNGQQMNVCWYWGTSNTRGEDPRNDYRLQSYTDIDKYKNDTGTTSPKNYISVVANIRVTDYEVSGDNEVMIDVTFSGAGTKANDAVALYAMYDATLLDRS